jgi:drug/metabolite transporter (DMT)-like permease
MLGAAAAMAIVGSSTAISTVLTDAPLHTSQTIRYVAAAGLLVAIARLRRLPMALPRGREWFWLLGVALTGLVVFNVAVVRGVAHAEPAVIAVAVACVPVLLALAGPLLEGRSPTRRVLLAAVVVTVGGVLVEGTGRAEPAGVAWAVVALACEAGFTLCAVPVLRRQGALGVSVHSCWLAALIFAGLGLTVEGSDAVTQLDGVDWAAIAYLTVLVTAVAFLLWYSAVSRLGAGVAGLLAGLAPIAAAAVGIAMGAGAPHPVVWAGMLLVLVGLAVGLSTSGPARAGSPEPHTRLSPPQAPSSCRARA